MEIGAVFILVVVLIVFAIIGVAIYAVAARGRQKQLGGEEGSLDAGRRPPQRAGEGEQRPEHLRVETEQQTRFAGTRQD